MTENPEYEFDDEPVPCDGCGKVDGHCPLCCPTQGAYEPGSDCDFCRYADECGG